MQDEQYFHSLKEVPLSKLIKSEYRTYQIYTLMDRAIPYLGDGLKPSQRRILFTLYKNSNKGLIKVSSLTGLVLTLHPHGPASIESSVVNMAQDYTFSNNYPLIEKKGYFGERMETQAAAARYIECKLGEMVKWLLFDDMNQVEMVPNYDEKVMEPVGLLPKLPLMLLNGAEGIGTGFSSVIPSFYHRDIIASMKQYLVKGKAKKINPWVHYYSEKIEVDHKGRVLFPMRIEQKKGKMFITELPRGFDAKKVYRHLSKFTESGFIKDYIDSTVDNKVEIELLFKRGQKPKLSEVQKTMGVTTTQVPNYTLISEKGVRVFQKVTEIIELFTAQRLQVTKRRYELLIAEYEERIGKNNEIIRFIKDKHYTEAEKSQNRKTFIKYLASHKFKYAEYLSDMAIYRMTMEEVAKRKLLVKEETLELKEFKKILKSPELIKGKLIEELDEVNDRLNKWLKDKAKQKEEVYKKTQKKRKKKS